MAVTESEVLSVVYSAHNAQLLLVCSDLSFIGNSAYYFLQKGPLNEINFL